MDINLTTLQRQDPKILKIVDSATQVAVYEFNSLSSEWVGDRTEAEGALFVCARMTEPMHTLIIMNRVCRENFVEHLTIDIEIVEKNPYLLYHRGEHIRGIWFYNSDECSKIFNLITKLLDPSNFVTKPPPIVAKPPLPGQIQIPAAGDAPDIVSILNRAHFQYDQFQTMQKTKSAPPSSDSTNAASSLTSLLRHNSNTRFAPPTPKTPIALSADGANPGSSILQRLFSAPMSYDNTSAQIPTSPSSVDSQTRPINASSTDTSRSLLENPKLSFVMPSPSQLPPFAEQQPVLLRPSDLSDCGLLNDSGNGMTTTTTSDFASLSISDTFHTGVPLNEEQERFRQAFIYCLENDSNFVISLNNAYAMMSKR